MRPIQLRLQLGHALRSTQQYFSLPWQGYDVLEHLNIPKHTMYTPCLGVHRTYTEIDTDDVRFVLVRDCSTSSTSRPRPSGKTAMNIPCACETQCVRIRAFVRTNVHRRVQRRVLNVQTCARGVFKCVQHMLTCVAYV